MVVVPSETVAAMVLIARSTQALNGGVNWVRALDKGCCQTSRKATPPVPEAGLAESPDCCEEPFEQAEKEPVDIMKMAMRKSKE